MSRLKIFVLLLSLLSFNKDLYAQANSLLWEVTGKELSKPSYLFGTIHIKDKRVFQWGDSVMVCFNNCETMAGELVLEEANAKELAGAIMMPGDTTLKMLVEKKEFKKIKKRVRKKRGLVYAMMVNKIKPVYTSLLLMETEGSGGKEEMEVPLDQYLQDLAKEKGMEVKGLETVQEQMQALEVMSLQEQADALVDEVLGDKKGKKAKQQLEGMINAYLKQNLDSLYSYFLEQEVSEEMMESLLYKRNKNMLEQMESLMANKPVFVAVGAAHLPGEAGLINLLREKGYKVRPVQAKKD